MTGRSVKDVETNRWDADGYRQHAGFVADLGTPLLALLDPRPGDRILDLGCGDGRLTRQVTTPRILLVGVDRSYSQAAATLRGGTIAVQADGQALPFAAGSFSAVLSNAALHWMRDQVRVLADVRRILGQEGRFVAEMGAGGNIDAIRSELYALLRAYGVDPEPRDPWFFPTPDEYRALLEQAGFAVLEMASWARPTPLPTGIDGWLRTFAGPFLNDLEPGTRVEMLNELQRLLASKLRTVDGRWIADYVRLRFVGRAL